LKQPAENAEVDRTHELVTRPSPEKKRKVHISRQDYAKLPEMDMVHMKFLEPSVYWAPTVLLDPDAKTVSMEATAVNFKMLFEVVRKELDDPGKADASAPATPTRVTPAPPIQLSDLSPGDRPYFTETKGWLVGKKVEEIATGHIRRAAHINARRRRFVKMDPTIRRGTRESVSKRISRPKGYQPVQKDTTTQNAVKDDNLLDMVFGDDE
jgi:hypothetical protein